MKGDLPRTEEVALLGEARGNADVVATKEARAAEAHGGDGEDAASDLGGGRNQPRCGNGSGGASHNGNTSRSNGCWMMRARYVGIQARCG